MSGKSGRQTLTQIFTVSRDAHLSIGAKVMWVVYRSYDSRGEGAFPGDELVASHLNCSQRTVQRWRAELIESGHLEQRLDGPKPARYHAILPERDDTDGEALSNEETTRMAHQAGERDDTYGEASCDDATSASPDDAIPVAPHKSTVSTLSTSVSSLRLETGDPQDGPPAIRAPATSSPPNTEPGRCANCGESKPASYRACFACLRAEAGFPARASRRKADADYTPGEKGLAAVCPGCGGGMAADAERCETCRSVPAELSPR